MTGNILKISDFSLRFADKEVVKHVSLTLAPGEMLALVGESGSGKSLTALSCLGLQPPGASLSGSIELDGIPVLRDESAVARTSPERASWDAQQRIPEATIRPLRGRTASMVFQEPMTALNPLHTIGKQIEECLRHGPWKPQEYKARVESLLAEVGLAHFNTRLNAYPHELSGGERQRVMIAMAIANNPKLLIADEPTTAVDVTVQEKIMALLKRLQKERGMAILLITHDLTLARRMANRVAVMKSGELVEQAATETLFTNPAHPYTRTLLASAPQGSMGPPVNKNIILECENLSVRFPVKPGIFRRITGYIDGVSDISISLPESSTLGIVGESGSGKSTLGNALLRLVKSEGKIVWLGRDISSLPTSAMRPIRRQMQLVFQDPYGSLNPRMTVGDIILEGLRVHEAPSPEHAGRLRDILSQVGLSPDMTNRFPHEFSGGQRQRIAVARAMILKPRFVVLDEPTSALDLTIQSQLIELLKSFQQRDGTSYLFISHDLRVVRAIAHRIAVLYKGRIVEAGDTCDVLANPREDYTKKLIEAAML